MTFNALQNIGSMMSFFVRIVPIRGDMEWYDWAHILWDSPEEDTNDSISILGKIHMFIDCRKNVFDETKHVNGIEIAGGDVYAVISSLTWK